MKSLMIIRKFRIKKEIQYKMLLKKMIYLNKKKNKKTQKKYQRTKRRKRKIIKKNYK